jgi:hypothetical protein
MNEELVDPKDLIIGKLKLELERKTRAIEQFKNYDKKRKEYYSNLALKVGELESYIAELEAGLEDDAIIKLQEKNRRLSKEVSRLMVKVALDKYDEDEIAMATTLNKLTMSKELKELRKKVKDDKNTLNNLLGIINKYREKYGEL